MWLLRCISIWEQNDVLAAELLAVIRKALFITYNHSCTILPITANNMWTFKNKILEKTEHCLCAWVLVWTSSSRKSSYECHNAETIPELCSPHRPNNGMFWRRDHDVSCTLLPLPKANLLWAHFPFCRLSLNWAVVPTPNRVQLLPK